MAHKSVAYALNRNNEGRMHHHDKTAVVSDAVWYGK